MLCNYKVLLPYNVSDNKRVLQMVELSAVVTQLADEDTHHCLLFLAVAIVITRDKEFALYVSKQVCSSL